MHRFYPFLAGVGLGWTGMFLYDPLFVAVLALKYSRWLAGG
jgi:hypothetical protein